MRRLISIALMGSLVMSSVPADAFAFRRSLQTFSPLSGAFETNALTLALAAGLFVSSGFARHEAPFIDTTKKLSAYARTYTSKRKRKKESPKSEYPPLKVYPHGAQLFEAVIPGTERMGTICLDPATIALVRGLMKGLTVVIYGNQALEMARGDLGIIARTGKLTTPGDIDFTFGFDEALFVPRYKADPFGNALEKFKSAYPGRKLDFYEPAVFETLAALGPYTLEGVSVAVTSLGGGKIRVAFNLQMEEQSYDDAVNGIVRLREAVNDGIGIGQGMFEEEAAIRGLVFLERHPGFTLEQKTKDWIQAHLKNLPDIRDDEQFYREKLKQMARRQGLDPEHTAQQFLASFGIPVGPMNFLEKLLRVAADPGHAIEKLYQLHLYDAGMQQAIANVLIRAGLAHKVLLSPFLSAEPRDHTWHRLFQSDPRLFENLKLIQPTEQAHATAIDLKLLFQSEIEVFLASADDESYSLLMTLAAPEGLPRVWMDPSQLLRIWAELLMNAIEASGQSLSVHMAIREEGPWVRVDFTDDAGGIPTRHRSHVFEKGYTTTNDHSGLGLWAIREIISQAGGFVGIHSDEDVGTTFSIWLPAVPRRSAPGIHARLTRLETMEKAWERFSLGLATLCTLSFPFLYRPLWFTIVGVSVALLSYLAYRYWKAPTVRAKMELTDLIAIHGVSWWYEAPAILHMAVLGIFNSAPVNLMTQEFLAGHYTSTEIKDVTFNLITKWKLLPGWTERTQALDRLVTITRTLVLVGTLFLLQGNPLMICFGPALVFLLVSHALHNLLSEFPLSTRDEEFARHHDDTLSSRQNRKTLDEKAFVVQHQDRLIQLPKPYAQILRDRYLQDLSTEVLAKAQNSEPSVISSKIRAAFYHFHNLLSPQSHAQFVWDHRDRLSELPDQDESILRARYLEAMTVRALASKLGASEGTVSNRYHTALFRFYERIQPGSNAEFVRAHQDLLMKLKPPQGQVLEGLYVQGQKRSTLANQLHLRKRTVISADINGVVRLREIADPRSEFQLVWNHPDQMAQLSQRDARILHERFNRGLTIAELATTFGISSIAVIKTLRSALTHLRRLVYPQGDAKFVSDNRIYLKQLKPKYARVLEDRFIKGLKVIDISRQMGYQSPQALTVLLKSALARLRAIITPQGDEKLVRDHQDLLSALSEKDARVLRGRFFEHMTLQELADKLKVSRESIRLRQRHALTRLKKAA